MAFPDISIGSTFDAKGFKQATTAVNKLEKNVKSLAKGFGFAFGATAITAFGKASVKAFAADDAAAKSLGQTLKNLNLAYGANIGTVNGFISRLESETGVLDDELRPAMDRLLRATGSVTKSQELLNLSLDIAAGTGKSVTQVSQSLQKAFLGQNQALGRLGIGLSKAELSSSSFEEIQTRLNELFAGQAVQAADSFQGSLNKLTVAANNAKETIGKGIIEALAGFSGKEGVGGAVSAIDKLANGVSDTITGIGYLAQKVEYAKPILVGAGIAVMAAWAPWFTAITAAVALVGYIGNKLKDSAGFQGMGNVPMTGGSNQDMQKYLAEQKKIADAKIKADKDAATKKALADKLAAAKKKKADELAAANLAKLAKANSLFDLENIQIEAALKGKISEEEKTRLLLMRAILEEDAATAEKLGKKLADIQKINFQIAADLAVIAATKDPFTTWAGSLSLALIELGKYNKTLADVPKIVPGVNLNPYQNRDRNYDDTVAAVKEAVEALAEPVVIPDTNNVLTPAPTTNTLTPSSDLYGFSLPDYIRMGSNFAGGGPTAAAPAPAPITVIVEGNVLDGNGFTDAVNKAFLDAQRRGLSRIPAGAIATP